MEPYLKAARLRSTAPVIAAVLLISTFLLSLVLILHYWQGIPIGDMVRDPTAVAGESIYVGFISQAGIFMWAGAAAVCLLGALVLTPKTEEARETRRFLLVSGLLSLTLGLDDVFLLHEAFFPHIGIPELVVFAAYGIFVAYYLLRFHRMIFRTEFLLLGMALGFFALSVLLDLLDPTFLDPDFWEDGSKVVGIVAWLAYYFRTTLAAVRVGALKPVSAMESRTYAFFQTPSRAG